MWVWKSAVNVRMCMSTCATCVHVFMYTVPHTNVTHQESQCNVCTVHCTRSGCFFFFSSYVLSRSLSLLLACDSNFLVQQINHFWAAWSLHVNDKQRQKLYSKQKRCSNEIQLNQPNVMSRLFGLVHNFLCYIKTKSQPKADRFLILLKHHYGQMSRIFKEMICWYSYKMLNRQGIIKSSRAYLLKLCLFKFFWHRVRFVLYIHDNSLFKCLNYKITRKKS